MAHFDWNSIRAEYELGASQASLAKRYGCSRKAIQKHILAEGWIQGNVSATLGRVFEEKVAGIGPGCDLPERVTAIDKSAEEKVAIVRRHRKEWEDHKHLLDDAIKEEDYEKARLAKITAETIKIRQEGERKAWGIIDITAPQTVNNSMVKIDLSTMPVDKIAELVNATDEDADRMFRK